MEVLLKCPGVRSSVSLKNNHGTSAKMAAFEAGRADIVKVRRTCFISGQ